MASGNNNSVSLLRIGLRQVELKEYCRLNEQVASGPVLVRLAPPSQEKLFELGHVTACRDGQSVTTRQRPYVALVLSGTVSLTAGGCEFATVGPGDFVGLEHLFPTSTDFDSNACGEVRLALFEPASLKRFLDGERPLLEYLRQAAARRGELAQENDDFLARW